MLKVDHYSEIDVNAVIPRLRRSWAQAFPNFTPEELACDGTDRLQLDLYAVIQLQGMRNCWGNPLVPTSAYRSPEHNRAVGGGERSQHLEGTAFDIACTPSDGPKLEKLALAFGATGIGRYPKRNFIHVDWRLGRPARWGKWS